MGMLQILKNPKSSVSEAYRTLRTNIQFSQGDKEIKTIVITSAGAGEGKSTTCSNIATAFAQSGHKVLIIDCDLRRPVQHKLFNISNEKGLTHFLIASCTLNEAVKQTEIEGLHIITAGVIPPNPSELINCKRFQEYLEKLKEIYDYIFIDTPPAGIVTDAQILAGKADGTVLVVNSRFTDKKAAAATKDLLDKVGAHILGVVLNKAVEDNKAYGKYYKKYYKHEYYTQGL